jgi:hypothetical protein
VTSGGIISIALVLYLLLIALICSAVGQGRKVLWPKVPPDTDLGIWLSLADRGALGS